MKRKQNICVWCGRRLWWWQKRRCTNNAATENEPVWCQTCKDMQRLPKSELRDWFNAAITCSIMCVILICVVLVIDYWGKL